MWGGGEQSFLISTTFIIAHYNTSYGCGKCLKQAFMLSSALHNHKKVCLRFTKKPIAGSDGKPSSRGGNGKTRWWLHQGNTQEGLQGSCCQLPGHQHPMASQTTPCHSGRKKSHCHKPHKDSKSKKDSSGDRKKKKKDVSPTRKGFGHKAQCRYFTSILVFPQ